MLKVMLVEDELLVRIGIKSIVDWERHGYTVVGEAGNGLEALEKIREDVPDIVLTDLVMEGMNGFELIQVLNREYPQVKIVVLSCYNDFQNVKEAMRMGACDYIFKLTIKPEELIQTLDAVRQKMGLSAPSTGRGQVDRIVHNNLDVIKSKLIRTLIEKSYVSAAECRKQWRQLQIKVDLEQSYLLLIVRADEFYLANGNSRIKERELLKFSMLNFLAEVFERYEAAEVFDSEGGDSLVIMNSAGAARDAAHETLPETFERLYTYMKHYLGISVSGGFSGVHQGLQALPQAHKEAAAALEKRFFSGGGQIYSYQETLDHAEEDTRLELPDNLDFLLLEGHLEHLEMDKALAFLERFFDYMGERYPISRHRIRNRMLDILYPFITVARKRGVDLEKVSGFGHTPYQVITEYESLQQIRSWFTQYARDFMEACRRMGQSRGREEIVRVKEYVKANLHKEIGVSAAAALVNMSESYFSHLYKKETGSSFVDYVNTMKIEKAKELLLQTDLKVYEIAALVGVENANYFSMLFKKLTGKSPNDYRR